MPVQKCEKDGQSGFKWGEEGICFIGSDAHERAAAVGRAVNAQLAENGNPPKKGIAGPDTGGEARRAIREMLKKGATIESIAAAANRDTNTINQILRGDIENPPSDLAANVRKAKIIKRDEMLFELQENKSNRVQVAKVGTFEHEVYGKFSITLDDMENMKSNFDANVRRQMDNNKPVLPFDYSHYDGDKAAGWIVGLAIENTGLFAEVEWTPKAAEKIRNKEFKFVSPMIFRNYKDAETGKVHKVVLAGAALTNIPFLRDMEAVHLLSESRRRAFLSLKQSGDEPDDNFNQGANMPISEEFDALSPKDKEKFLAECKLKNADDKELSEKLKTTKDALKLAEEKIKTLETDLSGSSNAGDKLTLAEGEIGKLKTQVSSLTKTMSENAQKAEFDQMLSEGRVCEAQRKSFMESDIAGFAKNAQEMKLGESGVNDKGDDAQSGAEEKIIKLAEEKAEKEKIEFGDAMSLVLSEKPELAKAAGY